MNRTIRRALSLTLALALWCVPGADAQNLTGINKLNDGGFEGGAPSYWAATGAGATWASDQSHSGERSLKLAGAGAANWTQAEAVRNWVPRFPASADLTFGAWVRTAGVNTNPATDAGKFQIVYTFRNAAGVDLLGQPVVLDLPQSAATSGWTQITTASLGAIVLPADAASATIVLRKGASATGTVWVDDFSIATSTSGVWPGDIHGANVDLPSNWYLYWDGYTSGVTTPVFAVTQTTTQSRSGGSSLRIEKTDPAATSEAVAISPRVPVTPGQPMLLNYWVKTEGSTNSATIGTDNNNIGLTALWYSSMQSGAAGYNELGGLDIRLNGEYNPSVIPLLPRQANNGWTNYAFVVYPRADAVAMELRLRYWHQFTGVTYWDDVAMTNVGGTNLVVSSENAPGSSEGTATSENWLRSNAPNPFTSQTEIRFTLPAATEVTLEVYDLLGRRVSLLADGEPMAASEHAVTFDRGSLPSGTYLVVLRTASHSEAQQVTIVR